jgi:hypothetical protein
LTNGTLHISFQLSRSCYEDKVYCNATSADTVNADYIFLPAEADWPPFFTKAVVFDLASNFAAGITQDASMAIMFKEEAELAYRRARFASSSSQTARNLDARSLIRKRLG